MKLSDIPSGESVFIDANIFLYHFAGVSHECKEFLIRCESGDIMGITGITVMAEVCHQLMIAEAVKKGLIRKTRAVRQLQKKSEMVSRLSEYASSMASIATWGIRVILLREEDLIGSQPFRSQFGLLTNDSFIPAYMMSANTNTLATQDQAFARIPSIRVYSPADI